MSWIVRARRLELQRQAAALKRRGLPSLGMKRTLKLLQKKQLEKRLLQMPLQVVVDRQQALAVGGRSDLRGVSCRYGFIYSL